MRVETRLLLARHELRLEPRIRLQRVFSEMCTHENKFTALSRLSNVAIASANNISDAVRAKVRLLTYDMIVVFLYTELNPCPRIGVL